MQVQTPTVTIGMPVRNGVPLLAKAIDSLLGQQYVDFELVISDNCSEDETEAVCEEYARRDCRIRYFRQKENIGPIANFEFVLRQAKGQLFMWAAHDDNWDKGWLAALVPHVYGKVVMAYGQIRGLNCETGLLMPPIVLRFRGPSIARGISYFMTPERKGKANLIYGLFRTSALAMHRFPGGVSYRHGSDMHVVFTAIQQGTFVYEPAAVMSKRFNIVHPSFRVAEIVVLLMNNITHYVGYVEHGSSIGVRAGIILAIPIKLLWTLGQWVHRKIQSPQLTESS
jgi:glycosyltransferase involved in cell wall biosynthesis